MAGYIDTWGRGINKIWNATKEYGLPEPEINDKNGGIEVILFNKQIQSNTSDKIKESFGMNSE